MSVELSSVEHGLRKIISVNTADLGGGAEQMAWLLAEAYGARGLESWLVVGDKKSASDRVMPFFLSPVFNYRPYAAWWTQGRIRAAKWLCRKTGVDDFEFPYARHLLELTGSAPDIVHCHNLHGGFFDLRALPSLSRKVPVFVTLEDAWLATGHCAFPMECERWRTGCGQCPDLARPPAVERDATAFNWQRKARILERCRLYIISPSRWMRDVALRSMLGPAVADCRIIPHGVDLQVFRPGNKLEARARLALAAPEIPPGTRLMVTAANAGGDNALKDWPTMRQALEQLSWPETEAPLHLMAVGGRVATECIGPVTVHHVGFLAHPELADCYRAADLFIHATNAESFGLVIAEAMACGTPVVVTDVGATPEVVGQDKGGFLVPAGDPAALAAKIRELLQRPDLLASLGITAACHAREHFDATRMVEAHLAYFAEVAAAWRAEKGDYVSQAEE